MFCYVNNLELHLQIITLSKLLHMQAIKMRCYINLCFAPVRAPGLSEWTRSASWPDVVQGD